MGVNQYSLVAHDWINLEQIINDLARTVGQELSVISEPTFAELTLTGLTASRLTATDADKQLESVSDLTGWIAGTENQIVSTDDEDGSLTLSLSDDLIIANLTSTGTIDASAGKVLVTDNGTVAPTLENDGYIGVAMIDGEARLYFRVNDIMWYINTDGIDASPVPGNPIGLLLSLTYA